MSSNWGWKLDAREEGERNVIGELHEERKGPETGCDSRKDRELADRVVKKISAGQGTRMMTELSDGQLTKWGT